MKYAHHPFTLRQLQYAVAIADQMSFRKAAEVCLVSQPSLSAQLAELERALGVQLFERDRRRVLLTAAGEELVERARRMLVDADDLRDAGRRLADPLSATLRVGVIPTISPYVLPEAAPRVSREHPQLTLRWLEEKTEVLLARIESGDLDAAVLAVVPGLENLELQEVGQDPFVLATAPDHPLGQSKKPVALRELADVPMLLLDDGHCFRDQALSFCKTARARELEFRATSLATLVQMVAAGAGVTLLPRLAVATENRRGALAIRPIAEPAPSRTLAVAWRRRAPLAPAGRALAATIARAIAG